MVHFRVDRTGHVFSDVERSVCVGHAAKSFKDGGRRFYLAAIGLDHPCLELVELRVLEVEGGLRVSQLDDDLGAFG